MNGFALKRQRGGFSIALVLLFCSISVVLLMAFVNARVSANAQNKNAFARLKAHWLAQSAVQHALLKLRILPGESFEASMLEKGFCPFVPVGTASTGTGTQYPQPSDEFRGDVNNTAWPIGGGWSEFNNWKYDATSIKPIMAETKGSERIHAVEIRGSGDCETKIKGVTLHLFDEVIRIVKVSRKN